MSVELRVPLILRSHVKGAATLPLEPGVLGELLSLLVEEHPGLQGQIFDDGGDLHRFINVYLNDEDVRYIDGLSTTIKEGDVLAILPAVAGGGP